MLINIKLSFADNVAQIEIIGCEIDANRNMFLT